MTYFRFVLGILTLLTGVAIAQELPPLDQMMELNRSGKWEQAAHLAQRFLDAKPEKSNDERCQAYYNLIYSQTRLGQIAKAKSNLTTFDQKCSQLPASNWVTGEVAKLRE